MKTSGPRNANTEYISRSQRENDDINANPAIEILQQSEPKVSTQFLNRDSTPNVNMIRDSSPQVNQIAHQPLEIVGIAHDQPSDAPNQEPSPDMDEGESALQAVKLSDKKSDSYPQMESKNEDDVKIVWKLKFENLGLTLSITSPF